MKALNIRSVDDALMAAIKARAQADHKTLRDWVLSALRIQLHPLLQPKTPRTPKSVTKLPIPDQVMLQTNPLCPEDGTPTLWNKDNNRFECPECGFRFKTPAI